MNQGFQAVIALMTKNELITQIAMFLLRVGRAIHRFGPGYRKLHFNSDPCAACGMNDGLEMYGVLWPELVLQWGLTPAWANWMDQREGLRCRCCRANLRSRQLAKSIVETMNIRLGIRADRVVPPELGAFRSRATRPWPTAVLA